MSEIADSLSQLAHGEAVAKDGKVSGIFSGRHHSTNTYMENFLLSTK